MAFHSQKSMDAAAVHQSPAVGSVAACVYRIGSHQDDGGHDGMSNGPADEGRPVVLRESSVVLGSLASGALSPTEARRIDRIAGPRSGALGALPVSVSRRV